MFSSEKGNVAKPFRLALGALIIQVEYGYSDEEEHLQIQEGRYLQFFCGFSEYEDEPPFDKSLMVHFRKRLSLEILGEINGLTILQAQGKQGRSEDGNDEDDSSNGGTLIVDATCAPSNIRYPIGTSLLNEARENSEKIINMLHEPGTEKKPRTYRRCARKEYLKFVRIRKPGKKKIHQYIKKQLGFLGRNLRTIEAMLQKGCQLSPRWQERLETLETLYEQQYMFKNKTHRADNRIVSISRPYLRLIVRGKAAHLVEFGANLDISVVNDYTRLETVGFDSYNKSAFFKTVIERYCRRRGNTHSGCLRIKPTATERICSFVRRTVFDCRYLH